MKTEFKKGVIVYDNSRHGKGVVMGIDGTRGYPINVKFDSGHMDTYTEDGRYEKNCLSTLSLTDYHFDNNQEKPEPIYEKGQEVYVSDDKKGWYFGRYIKKNEDAHRVAADLSSPIETLFGIPWKFVSIEKPF